MSNLSNPYDSILQQAGRLPNSGAIDKINKRLDVKSDKLVILLDISLSMNERVRVESPRKYGERKIDILKNVFRRPKAANEIAIAFNNTAKTIEDFGSIPEPDGSTDLAMALALAITIKPKATLIISDGMPDSQQKALSAANNLTGIINCLFIGNKTDTEAIAFMRQLATLGCGKVTVCDISRRDAVPKLASALKLLLLPSSNN